MIENLYSISPVEGRYEKITQEIKEFFNEYNLIKYRVIVEIKWLEKIFEYSKEFNINYTENDIEKLEEIIKEFNLEKAKRVKEIEETTKHDVKAVEYFLREEFKNKGIEKYNNLIHFACTSEDINNISYGIMIKNLRDNVLVPNIDKLISTVKEKIKEYANIKML